jgi:two-component system sensor histidine kinase RegB
MSGDETSTDAVIAKESIMRQDVALDRGGMSEWSRRDAGLWSGVDPVDPSRWLNRLRWATAVIQLGVTALVLTLPDLDVPLHELLPLLAMAALTNGAIATWLSLGRELPRLAAGASLLLDVIVLTGLLEITGGPFNPFIVIYGVQVALAACTLGRAWAWVAGSAAIGGFGWLVYHHMVTSDVASHHRLNDLPTHLFTMWTAFAVSAELVGYFVTQASRALTRRQRELEEERARSARNERLAALTTLAAGAAHELATPLGTIAVASRELERTVSRLEATTDLGELLEDARLIRVEVDRCCAVLDQMSGRAGGAAADAVASVDPATVAAAVKERLTADQVGRLLIRVEDGVPPLALPPAGIVQVVTALVRNAFEAVTPAQPVTLEIHERDGRVRFEVRDEGAGMPPGVLVRAGEPFYSTKEPGRGMGLGLFLARVFAERFGGSLILQSDRGTTAVLEFPAAAGADA